MTHFLLFSVNIVVCLSHLVASEEQWQRMVAVRAGRFATCWHSWTHSEPECQQLHRGGAPNLVLSAQHIVSCHVPRCLSQILQRAECIQGWRGMPAPVQRLLEPCSSSARRQLREVVGFGHTHLYFGLLPTAALHQPHRGAVGSSSWCGTLA